MKITVPSFGLHWITGGLGVLVQKNGTQDVTGIDMGLEVTVDQLPLPPCPHNIDLQERSNQTLPDHPLILTALPVPKIIKGPVYVADNPANRDIVKSLLRLSSSSQGNTMYPIWMLNGKQLRKQLSITNLTPLVLYGYTGSSNQNTPLQNLLEVLPQYERPVIIMGDQWIVPQAVKIDFTLDDLPLEQIGANVLYERMHG